MSLIVVDIIAVEWDENKYIKGLSTISNIMVAHMSCQEKFKEVNLWKIYGNQL